MLASSARITKQTSLEVVSMEAERILEVGHLLELLDL